MVRRNLFRSILGKTFVAIACASACGCGASAQTYRDVNGSIVAGVMPLPYAYTPLAPGQYNLTPATVTALTIPRGARFATICASSAGAMYTTDGVTTPTSAIGQPLPAGSCVSLSGGAVLANFRVVSPSGVLDVEYFQ
ncbi:hypothetical protein DFR50_107124 [Roseiarcus fermentans]|uniref:Uncharacterized protein n=1 Tax=Roseiarcus fermentans TaxID=1473586 RepID=A0A366FMD9_9HYPH|nr:hypothetical protein [Roseiarcus fermentans]RBP15854.1 hypothetical protein DFR50_107124 [Roseiarcus fermentans]